MFSAPHLKDYKIRSLLPMSTRTFVCLIHHHVILVQFSQYLQGLMDI